MSAFRTVRPLLVDATQCESAKTIATDTGFCNVSKGDWIVKGENGETYVVDDTFFQLNFYAPAKLPLGAQKRKKAVITAADPGKDATLMRDTLLAHELLCLQLRSFYGVERCSPFSGRYGPENAHEERR